MDRMARPGARPASRRALAVAVVLALVVGGAAYFWLRDADARALRGRKFLSQSFTEEGRLRPDMTVSLQFWDDGRLTAHAGCNGISTDSFSLRGGRLRITEWGQTAMACDEARHAQDDLLADLLTSEPEFRLDGDRLTLRSEVATVVLLDREVADPDRPLIGTKWRLSGQHEGGGDHAIARPARGATLRFEDDRVTFQIDDCNGGTVRAEIRERTIHLPDSLITTTAVCSEEHQEVERLLSSVLDGTVSYDVDAGELSIDQPDGPGLTFRAED